MIKLFEQFNNEQEIHEICKEYLIENYTINNDGSIDVNDNVYLYNKGFTKLPIRFNKVSGNFLISDNKLTTLNGCPKEVGGYFSCKHNCITSLKGGPKEVGRFFECTYNELTSLGGSPTEVGGNFNCYGNQLVTLEGSPKYVRGSFSCFNNPLKTLKGIPTIIEEDLHLSDLPIKTIDCSTIITGDIYINIHTSGLPSIIKGLSQDKLRILFEYGVDYNIFDKDGNVNHSRLERMFKDFNI